MKTTRPLIAIASAAAAIAGVATLSILPAEASVYNGNVQLTCTQAIAQGTGSHVLDRDNTGTGEESLLIEVRDGAGNLILSHAYSNILTTFNGGIGTYAYTTSPVANPLTFQLISVAGNGLPAQVDVYATAACEGLPDYNSTPPTRPELTVPSTTAAPTTAPTTTAPPTTVVRPTTTAPPTSAAPTTAQPTTTMMPVTPPTNPGQTSPAAAARPVSASPSYTG